MHEKLVRVRAAYQAFAKGDRQPLIDLIGAECRTGYFGDPARVPWAGTFAGPEGFAQILERIGGAMAISEYRATEFLPSGDALVVLGVGRGTARQTARPFEAHWAHYLRFDGGRVAEFRVYNDTLALAAAVGL